MTNTYELVGGPMDGEQRERADDRYPGDVVEEYNGRRLRYACTCVMSVVRSTGLHGAHAIYRYRGVIVET